MTVKLLKAVQKLDTLSHKAGLYQGMDEHTDEVTGAWDHAAEDALFQVQEVRLKLIHLHINRRMETLRSDVYTLEHQLDRLGLIEESLFRQLSDDELASHTELVKNRQSELLKSIESKRKRLIVLAALQDKVTRRDFQGHVYPF